MIMKKNILILLVALFIGSFLSIQAQTPAMHKNNKSTTEQIQRDKNTTTTPKAKRTPKKQTTEKTSSLTIEQIKESNTDNLSETKEYRLDKDAEKIPPEVTKEKTVIQEKTKQNDNPAYEGNAANDEKEVVRQCARVERIKNEESQGRYMNVLIHFGDKDSNLSDVECANVERVAMYLKNHPKATCVVKGYAASNEGSNDYIIRLANERTETVTDMLVNRYKIDSYRIDAQGCGESSIFNDTDWNRVVICELSVKN